MATASTRLPFDSPREEVEATAAAARAAEKDYRKLEKAITDAANAGKSVSATQVDALNQARARADQLKETVRRNKELEHSEHGQHAMERKYERLGHKLSRIFGDQLFRKLASGEKIEAKDVIRGIVQDERAVIAAGRALGADVKDLARSAPLIGLLAEVSMKYFEIAEQQKERERNADVEQERFRKGLLGPKAFEALNETGFFDKFIKTISGTDYIKDARQKLDKKTKDLTEMTPQDIDLIQRAKEKEFDTSLPMRKWNGEDPSIAEGERKKLATITDEHGNRISGDQIKARIAAAVQKEREHLHAELSPATLERIQKEAVADIKVGEKTFEEFEKGAAMRAVEKEKVQSPSAELAKHRHEQMTHAMVENYAKRVPPNPTD